MTNSQPGYYVIIAADIFEKQVAFVAKITSLRELLMRHSAATAVTADFMINHLNFE